MKNIKANDQTDTEAVELQTTGAPAEETVHVSSSPANNTWDSGIKTVKSCGLCDAKPTIAIVWKTYNNIIAMCRHMQNTEWLGYLIGTYIEADDLYVINDIFVPVQEVDGTSVENIDIPNTIKGIIGTVHSHHSMGAFFSGTDDSFIGSNHDVMIVVSGAAKTKQQVRKKLPCGHYTTVDAELIVYDPDNNDSKKFVEENVGKFHEAPLPPPTQWQGYPFGYGGYFEDGFEYPYPPNHNLRRRPNLNPPNNSQRHLSRGAHAGGRYGNIGGRIVEIDPESNQAVHPQPGLDMEPDDGCFRG